MPDSNAPASGFQFGLANLKPAEPTEKVALTFPDGAKREFPKDTTGLEIARGISPSLAKRTVAMALDGVLTDLNDPISNDAKIELIARDDARALELISSVAKRRKPALRAPSGLLVSTRHENSARQILDISVSSRY